MTSTSTVTRETTKSVVSLENVTFSYGDVPVLEDITMDVELGAFLGLVGPNGSGNSTLLELMLGLRRPDSGSVTLYGDHAHEFDAGERIGYVAQNVMETA